MRILRSDAAGIISVNDIDRITMEIVNIYHGIQYYDAEKRAELKKPIQKYLSISHGTFVDTIIPVKGYVYVRSARIQNKITNIVTRINARFNTLNKWGSRPVMYTYTPFPNEMTVAAADPVATGLVPIRAITKKAIYKGPVVASQMEWIVTDDRSLFNYSDLVLPDGADYKVMAAASTIVIDDIHDIPIPEKFTISLPSLPGNIKIIKTPISTNKYFGYEFGVWRIAFGIVGKAGATATWYAAGEPIGKPVYEYDDKLDYELSSKCDSCGVAIWGEYYHTVTCSDVKPAEKKKRAPKPRAGGERKNDNRDNKDNNDDQKKQDQKPELKQELKQKSIGICKFCAHCNIHKFGDTDIIMVRKSPVKVINVILGYSTMDPDVRDALRHLVANPFIRTQVPGTTSYVMRSGPYMRLEYGDGGWENYVRHKQDTIIIRS